MIITRTMSLLLMLLLQQPLTRAHGAKWSVLFGEQPAASESLSPEAKAKPNLGHSCA